MCMVERGCFWLVRKRGEGLMIDRIDVECSLDSDWGIYDHGGWTGCHSSIGWYGCRNEVGPFSNFTSRG